MIEISMNEWTKRDVNAREMDMVKTWMWIWFIFWPNYDEMVMLLLFGLDFSYNSVSFGNIPCDYYFAYTLYCDVTTSMVFI